MILGYGIACAVGPWTEQFASSAPIEELWLWGWVTCWWIPRRFRGSGATQSTRTRSVGEAARDKTGVAPYRRNKGRYLSGWFSKARFWCLRAGHLSV